ncbi:hypothetical protein Acr_00g0091680 [Actinidia rufa]|uniref:Isopenicillin N synthase-like Fe(2+) 2OG dioxygenase domain-containing protein n=1 Tax=Actinidia rufa TaxID=165716 RepID=A0A7J0DX89_9ERIC|nr:hypothetical protein Acr_00g0091680 [Actinidia rufa]
MPRRRLEKLWRGSSKVGKDPTKVGDAPTRLDLMWIITNGLYRSAQHRAITNVGKARLSVATFHDPAKTRIICPASELISESSPLRYCQVTYGDYVSSWYTNGPDGKRNIDGLLL